MMRDVLLLTVEFFGCENLVVSVQGFSFYDTYFSSGRQASAAS